MGVVVTTGGTEPVPAIVCGMIGASCPATVLDCDIVGVFRVVLCVGLLPQAAAPSATAKLTIRVDPTNA
jgi:hypothetical protein